MSQLLPVGVEGLGDAPYTLHSAICQALRILQYEEFPLDERPPRRIWLDGPRLEEHWARIDQAREERYGGGSRPSEPDGPVEENALELIKRG